MEIGLHPLVIFNIADHHTRAHLSQSSDNVRVVGAVLGQQIEKVVHVINSFELTYKVEVDDKKEKEPFISFDEDVFVSSMELYKSVFPDHEFLGWYSTGEAPLKSDIYTHQTLTKYNENPLYFVLNNQIPADAKDLPISAHVIEVRFIENHPISEFIRIPFKVFTNEAERITIDHIAADMSSSSDRAESHLSSPLQAMLKAITALETRVQDMFDFLMNYSQGTLSDQYSPQKCDELLKSIKEVCNRLPVMDSDAFQTEFSQELNDGMLLTYLATLTKTHALLNEACSKFSLVNEGVERPGSSRRTPKPYGRGFANFGR